jgi:hypothetical protein
VFQELLVAADVVKMILDRGGSANCHSRQPRMIKSLTALAIFGFPERQLSSCRLCSPGWKPEKRLPRPRPIDSMSEIVRNSFGADRSEVANERDDASSDEIEDDASSDEIETEMKDFSNASFPPEMIGIMQEALDAAVATLPEPVSSAHVQSIAETILRTAKDGERDPHTLQRMALIELQISPRH